MRRYFVIGSFAGVGALLLGACGSDNNGGGAGATGGSGGGLAASGGIGGIGGSAASGGTSATGGNGGTSATGGTTGGSCQGSACDDTAVPNGDGTDCYCDDICVDNGDCCADKETYCPATPPVPTTCKKFCCADTDCGSGESCTAFGASLGTIGVCQGGTATDAGTGGLAGAAGGGSAGAAGTPAVDSGTPDTGAGGSPPGDAGPLGLPPGCVIATPPCNPLTNSGCTTAGAACDLATGSVFQCFDPPNDVQPGGDCSNSNGPFCIAGYHCSE